MPAKLSIKGLVQLSQALSQHQPAASSSPAIFQRWQECCLQALRDVEGIFQRTGGSAADLSPKARSAYQYLLSVSQLTAPGAGVAESLFTPTAPRQAPAARPTQPPPPAPAATAIAAAPAGAPATPPRHRGAGAWLPVLHQLATNPAADPQALYRRIASLAHAARPRSDNHSPAARRQSAYLSFLAEAQNWALYCQALARAQPIFAAGLAQDPRGSARRMPKAIIPLFEPMHGIYHLRVSGQLSLPVGMLHFSEAGFTSLAGLLFARDRTAKQQVIELLQQEPVVSLQRLFQADPPPRAAAAHDLSQSLARVDAQYLRGSVPFPRLVWSPRHSARRMGYYDFLLDQITVSRTLDDVLVPAFVVDFIVYHELLHKKHGIRWQEGRQHTHTREFRSEERLFSQFQQAASFLDDLASKVASRHGTRPAR